MYIEAIPREVVLGVGAATIIFANLRGGQDVRVGAAVVTIYVVFDFAHLYPPFVGLPETVVGCAILVACALWSRRLWSIWAAATQVLALATDLLRTLAPVTDWAYFSAQVAWFLTLCGAVAVGAATRSVRAA